MRIIADNNITDATITATNELSFQNADKLKSFNLSDKLETTTNNTVIDIDFGMSSIPVDSVVLCGTNLSPSVSITVSWSDTAPSLPDGSKTLTDFSTFNQVVFLDSAETKRYWRITISDPAPNNSDGSNRLFIGYIYIGQYTQVDAVEFPHTPSLNISSSPAISATRQGYGSKGYGYYSVDFTTIGLTFDKIDELLQIVEEKQNIDRIVLIEYEDSITERLYRPKYGVLTGEGYPFAQDGNPGYYNLRFSFEERF